MPANPLARHDGRPLPYSAGTPHGAGAFPSRFRRTWEPRVTTFVVFYIVCGAGTSLFFSGDEVMATGRSTLRLLWLPIYALILGLAAPYWRPMLHALKRDWCLTLLLAVALASAAWSVDAGLTIRRCLALAMTTLFGLFLAVRFNHREILEMLFRSLATALVLSLIAVVVVPDLATMYEGKWRGLYGHKNSFGRKIVFTGLTIFCLRAADPSRRWILLWLAPCLLALVFAGSATAWLNAMILPAAWIALRSFQRNPLYAPIVPALMLAGVLVGVFVIEPLMVSVFESLGRDATLTGRTDLWVEVLNEIRERPILGHGYGAFWGDPSDLSMLVWDLIGWDAPHAHNGILELALGMGVVGVVLFLASYGRLVLRALVAPFKNTSSRTSYWVPLFLVFLTINNLTEVDGVLDRHSSSWVLYVLFAYGGVSGMQVRGR